MKIKKILCVFLAAIILAVCIPLSASAEKNITASFVEDEVIFEYSPVTSRARRSSESFEASLDSLGITELSEINTYDYNQITTSSVINEPILYVAKISGDVEETCRKLEQLDEISYAEPNYLFETDGFTMPGEVANQGKNYTNYEKWYLEDVMHIPEAWEKYETCGEGVTIAVIDNGFNLEATEFPVNLWDDGKGNHGWNTASDSADISPIYKPDGTALNDTSHGTNVAGIIGMEANGANCIGAAYGAELMLLNVAQKCTSNSDTRTKIKSDDLVSAIYYAAHNEADIINMSLGTSAYPTSIKNAVDAAYYSGVVLVAAAGNSAELTDEYKYYPAAAENVIGVMAIDKDNPAMLSNFSNYDTASSFYDVAAPGCAIFGCGLGVGKFTLLTGTSQATPLVSSCIALYLSVYPNARIDKVYQAVRNSATDFVKPNSSLTTKDYRYDVLNALNLLAYGTSGYPELEFNLATRATSNTEKHYIYGLDEGFTDISDYVTVKDGTGTAQFVPTSLGNGTGSQLKIFTADGDLYETYTIIIYGDVNGDCIIDGQDAVIINCIANKFGSYPDYLKHAADADGNNSVDSADVTTTEKYAINLDYIDQFR